MARILENRSEEVLSAEADFELLGVEAVEAGLLGAGEVERNRLQLADGETGEELGDGTVLESPVEGEEITAVRASG